MATIKNNRNALLYAANSVTSGRVTGAVVTVNSGAATSLLVPKGNTVPVPGSITLTALATGYITPGYTWVYRFGTSGSWTGITGTTNSVNITLDATWLTTAGTNTVVQYQVTVSETASGFTTGVNQTSYIHSIPLIREGADGFNNLLLTLYKRTTTSTAPTVDYSAGTNTTYSFNTGTVVGQPTGWTKTIPDSSNGAYLWTIQVQLASTSTQYTFANTLWPTTPVLYTQNGTNGQPGGTGASTALVYAYKRSTSAPTDNPGAVDYSFSTNTISTATLANNWLKTIPSGTDPLYVTVATASSNTGTDNIAANEWASPVLLVQNGTSPLIYDIVTSAPVITKDAVDAATSGTYSAITIQGKKYDGNTTTNFGWITTTENGGNESSRTDTANSALSYTMGAGKSSVTIKLYNAATGGNLIDTQVVYAVYKGSTGSTGAAALSAILSNEAHVLPASAAGAVSSYTGSGTEIRVYEGATELTYDGTGTTNGTWTVTAAATNVTVGTISDSGTYATVAEASGVANGTDASNIVYTITGKTASGTGFTLTKKQTFSKSKTGTDAKTFKVIATELDYSGTGYIYINNTSYSTTSRGHSLIVYNPATDSVVSGLTTYDTYGSDTSTLVTALNSVAAGNVVLITTFDATTCDAALRTALQSFGSASTATWGAGRVSHAFIGQKGAPIGSAFESTGSGAAATSIQTQVAYYTQSGLVKNGALGLNTATVYLYARNNSISTAPTLTVSDALTYTFSTGVLSGTLPSGWSTTIPAISNGAVLWVTNATVANSLDIDTIGTSEWSTPKISSSVGERGTKTLYDANSSYTAGWTYLTNAAGPDSYAAKATSLIATAAGNSLPTTPLAGDTVTFSNSVTSKFTGSLSAYVLTVTAVSSGTVQLGQTLGGANILAGTVVTSFISGTNGGVGTYGISRSQTAASTTITATLGDYVYTITHDGTSWKTPGTVIDGSLLVTGSITASKINSNGLSIKDASGNVILQAGTSIDWPKLGGASTNLTGLGYTGALDANKTYVDANGAIQGVSSGANTTVANSAISISGGAIQGIGTGSGTVVDNAQVQVGGTNLLFNSGRFTSTDNWFDNGGGLQVDGTVTYGGYNTMKILGTGADGVGIKEVRVRANTVYTVSALVKASAPINSSGYDNQLHIQNWTDENGSVHQETAISSDNSITTSWRVISQTFQTAASATAGYVRVYFYPLVAGTSVNIAWVKLEQGNKATDWAPNPDEIKNAVNSIVTSNGGLLPNWNLDLADKDNKPAGILSVEGIVDTSGIAFGDSTNTWISIAHATDTTISYGFPAIPIDDSQVYSVTVRHKTNSANPPSTGLHLYFQELNTVLPQGKTHIGTTGASSSTADRSSAVYMWNNKAYPNNSGWVEQTLTYVPTEGTKFASFSMANWNNATTVQYHVDAVYLVAKSSTTYRQATQPSGGTYVKGDVWINSGSSPTVTYIYDGSTWQISSNYTTNTNELTDGAGLGTTAVWSSVSGTGKPIDNAGAVLDTRSVDTAPSGYSVGNFREFKTATTIGLTGTETYCILETIKGWSDNSGGSATQWAYMSSGEVWKRSALSAASSWGAWVRDLDRNVYTGDLNANKTYIQNGTIQGVSSGAGTVVDNTLIDIGGTNLLKNSTSETFASSLAGPVTLSMESVTLPDGSTGNAIKLVTGGTAGVARMYNCLRGNDIYSFSTYHKVSTGTKTIAIDAADVAINSISATTSWQWYAHEGFSVSNYSLAIYNFIDINIPANTTLYFWHPKVEFGNKATDWLPAIEDLNASISYAATTATWSGVSSIPNNISTASSSPTVSILNNAISIANDGTLSGAGGGQVTIGGLGYTGALDANKTYIDSNGNIQGVSSGGGQSVANNQDSIIRAPAGALYTTTAGTITGRLKVRLPQSFTNTMMRFTVEIYEYSAGYMCTLEIGGYNYSATSTWYNVSARVIGGSNVEYPVYFGYDGTKCCVWIGSAKTETWSYPQVRVRDFFAGYSNYEKAKWESGWAISFDQTDIASGTGTDQYSAVVTDTLPGADWSKIPNRSGKPADNATVGAPAGTYVGGTLAETVVSNAANGATAYNSLGDKLNKAGDTITGRINMNVPDGLFAGTDLNNGVYLGSLGLVGKKNGTTTVTIGTDGSANFSGAVTGASITGGTITGSTITGATIQTATSGQRIALDNKGLLFLTGATSGKYGSPTKYGSIKYGSGVLVYFNNASKKVPFYVSGEQNVADIHLYNRNANPTGGTYEAGDMICVNGRLKIYVPALGGWKTLALEP